MTPCSLVRGYQHFMPGPTQTQIPPQMKTHKTDQFLDKPLALIAWNLQTLWRQWEKLVLPRTFCYVTNTNWRRVTICRPLKLCPPKGGVAWFPCAAVQALFRRNLLLPSSGPKRRCPSTTPRNFKSHITKQGGVEAYLEMCGSNPHRVSAYHKCLSTWYSS
jgi:hypothetical protein